MQRRQALREKLKLDQYDSGADEPDNRWQDAPNDQAKPSQTSVHDLGNFTSVVTVETLGLNDERYATSAIAAPPLSNAEQQLKRLTKHAAGALDFSCFPF